MVDIIKKRHKDGFWEIDWNADEKALLERFQGSANLDSIQQLQVVVHVMCGGGWLGQSACEYPADFYIDARTGKLPYPARQIQQAVKILAFCADLAGYNTKATPVPGKLPMPKRPQVDNLGIL